MHNQRTYIHQLDEFTRFMRETDKGIEDASELRQT
jgi:hypothetical protein